MENDGGRWREAGRQTDRQRQTYLANDKHKQGKS